ncbi:MAG TPA: hypothetical protein PLM09_15010 [Casimicrobiaceae bacterium]|nr:hypothetical protein [Casimicrobiaceae bacterium]
MTAARLLPWFVVACAFPLVAHAVTPAQEKAFVETWRKAFESKDAATLESLLDTKGADREALEFYRAMMTEGMGARIDAIALEPLSEADRVDAARTLRGPGGKELRLTLVPVRKLVVRRTHRDGSGSSTSTSRVYVAESGGRLVVPVPGPAR